MHRITNLHTIKVLCHRAEVAKNFQCCTTDCVFCSVIGGEKFFSRKYCRISLILRPSPAPVFDRLQYAADHVVRFTRLSGSIFAYCKRSKTGAGEGLGMRLM